MNLFILSSDPEIASKYHVDKHVNKMILEAAQLLSTAAFSVFEGKKWTGYRPTHVNHPCAKWVRENRENWLWCREYATALKSEWNYRYSHDKDHASLNVIRSLNVPDLPNGHMTPFAQAMPIYCKHDNAIIAYRQYYALCKAHLFSWKKRKEPFWLQQYMRHTLLNYGTVEHADAFHYYLNQHKDKEVLQKYRSLNGT